MTRTELRTRLLEALDEDPEDPQFVTTAQADRLLDEAQEVLAEETRALKRRYVFARGEGALLHSTNAISPDIMAPYRLYAPRLRRRLECVTFRELDRRHSRWWTQRDAPWVWTHVSWDTFLVWPHAGPGGEVVELDALVWPKPLLDDGDEPEWPESDHDGLVLYGVYEGLLKRWDVNGATAILARFMEAFGQSERRHGDRIMQEGPGVRGTHPVDTTPWREGRY